MPRATDALARGVVGLPHEVIALLAGGVGADDGEAVARRGAAVTGPGREDEHVALPDLERLALGPPNPKNPNALMHYLKMAFNKAYFHIVPSGWV